MRTPFWTLLVALVAVGSAPAAPKLEIPPLVRQAGGYAIVEPDTECKSITFGLEWSIPVSESLAG